MSKETDFQWTDKLVLDFAGKLLTDRINFAVLNDCSAAPVPMQIALNEFKAGSPSGRDFEITCYKKGDALFDCIDGIPVGHNYWMNDKDASIHSVKRLSDGEVFKVGDVVGAKHKANVTIKLFNIVKEKMMVECGDDYCDLYWLTKMVSGEPLFITFDGKELFNANDRCWWLRVEDWEIGIQPYVHKELSNDKHFKYFSTEEAAKTYCFMNKPCLSLVEVIQQSEWHSGGNDETVCFKFKKSDLKKFAQQKINNPS